MLSASQAHPARTPPGTIAVPARSPSLVRVRPHRRPRDGFALSRPVWARSIRLASHDRFTTRSTRNSSTGLRGCQLSFQALDSSWYWPKSSVGKTRILARQPWSRAFILDRFLPSSVRGPVLRWLFLQFASICAAVARPLAPFDESKKGLKMNRFRASGEPRSLYRLDKQ